MCYVWVDDFSRCWLFHRLALDFSIYHSSAQAWTAIMWGSLNCSIWMWSVFPLFICYSSHPIRIAKADCVSCHCWGNMRLKGNGRNICVFACSQSAFHFFPCHPNSNNKNTELHRLPNMVGVTIETHRAHVGLCAEPRHMPSEKIINLPSARWWLRLDGTIERAICQFPCTAPVKRRLFELSHPF